MKRNQQIHDANILTYCKVYNIFYLFIFAIFSQLVCDFNTLLLYQIKIFLMCYYNSIITNETLFRIRRPAVALT